MTINTITTGINSYESTRLEKTNKKHDSAINKKRNSEQNDTVSLSGESKLLAAGMQEAQNTPEIRQEKVAALKEQIQNDTYQINPKAIATKIVDEGFGLLN